MASAESETVVENDLYKITFTNRGAQVKSWILKKYRDDKGNPLELVSVQAAVKFGYPLSFFTYDDGLRKKLNDALYVASATGDQHSPVSITFEYSDGATVARKSFSFDEGYVVKAQTSVFANGSAVPASRHTSAVSMYFAASALPCGTGLHW